MARRPRLVVCLKAKPHEESGAGGMAGTHDPNYQTLAGIGGDCFEEKKKDGGAALTGDGGPKPPAGG